MIESEAIEWLKFIGNQQLPYDKTPRKLVCQMAIKALEKQIPKKVNLYIGNDMSCPACGHRLRGYEGIRNPYCKYCGQQLDR